MLQKMITNDTESHRLAKLVIGSMFDRDEASRGLGMEIQSVGPGCASVTMTIRPDMLNGHKTCHGGFIFALADSAFAFACNSRNDAHVGAACEIEYLYPGREGDFLRAEAIERAISGKSGVYDVSVYNQTGKLIAVFRGKSHRIRGFVVPEITAAVPDCTNQQGVCT